MRNHRSIAVTFGATCLSIAAAFGAHAQSGSAQADAAQGDWITFGRDYANQRFSPLRAIDRSNVAKLAPAFVYPLGGSGSVQTHPLVVDGVMSAPAAMM
jgi:alcohol dehydrogenase (cytochrome c)